MICDSKRLTLTIKEAAAVLGISRNLAYDLARRGKLIGLIRLGRKRMVVSKFAIDQLLHCDTHKEVEYGDESDLDKTPLR